MSVQIESNAAQYGEVVSFQSESNEKNQISVEESRYSPVQSSSHLAGTAIVGGDDAYVADWVI